MKKVMWHFFIIVYVLVSIFITLCLLSYNEYNVTQFGSKILILVKNDDTGSYNKGDLVITSISDNYAIKDKVFYYILKEKRYYINVGEISKEHKKMVTIDNELVDNDLIIGSTNESIVLPILGGVLSFLESKWGYLCVVILPILVAFLYEIYSIIKEFKKK